MRRRWYRFAARALCALGVHEMCTGYKRRWAPGAVVGARSAPIALALLGSAKPTPRVFK